MKQEMKKMNFAQISRTVLWLSLIVCACFTAARAQASGTVIPSVCFEAKPETLTRTLTNSFCVGSTSTVACNSHTVGFSPAVPFGFYTVIFNPGPTQDTLYGYNGSAGLSLTVNSGLPFSQSFSFAHAPGETLLIISEGEAVYGYNNLSSTTVNIPRGISSQNYFAPGNLIYPAQPNNFLPGVHGDALRLKAVAGAPAATWVLPGGQAVPNVSAGQGCGTITYQGRLSDAGNPANGQFDLQFQAFDTDTGGIAQSELITLQDVQVTNGIFTVPLFFGSTFINNFKPRFLQIGVRPGNAPNTDPFTVLTPRQPLTQVPYAVNAQNAANAKALDGVAANQYFKITGGTINGNLTVTGTINGTVTNATNATNAVNATNATNATTATTATNATQLGGVPAANYLTNTSFLGQSVTTASGTGSLSVTGATTAYTLVPGLAQTVDVPATGSLLISTDGGIQSSGAISTFSVIDAAIFVDGASVGERRIVISNFSVAASVGNWALTHGLTLPAGSHAIEVRVRYGSGTGGQSATISSSSDPLLRGQLTVAVIRR